MSEAAPSPPVATPEQNTPILPKALRWWPAALLVALMAIVRFGPRFLESPSGPVIMTTMFGGLLLTILMTLWWLFFSRATWSERGYTLLGSVVIAAVGIFCLHKSMQGMGAVVVVIPSLGAAFGLTAVVASAWQARSRMALMLFGVVATMFCWELVQSKGLTGSFASENQWRWEATAEERYLAARAEAKPPAAPVVDDTNDTDLVAEWPSFRGPNRDGRAPGVALAEDWKAQPPQEIWRRPIGPAWSSFVVAGDRLFTQEQRADKEAVVCLDAKTGQEIWSYDYEDRFWDAIAGAGPRATPTLADNGLYAFGAQGKLVKLNPRTGKLLWSKDVKSLAGREPPPWGFSSTPLVAAGRVIVHAGGKDDKGVFAFDAQTGEVAWSAPSGDHSYSSAQLASFQGTTVALMVSNSGVQAFEPESGKELWNHAWAFQGYRALQPAVVNDALFVSTPMNEGTRRLSVKNSDAKWDLKEEWTSREMKCDFNDSVEHRGFLYGFDGSIFACIDASNGKLRWKKGRYGKGQVLLLPDADQLLVLSEQGDIVLLRATPDKWDERAKVKGLEGKTWNHPVVIGNRLYIRNAEEAACFQLALETRPSI